MQYLDCARDYSLLISLTNATSKLLLFFFTFKIKIKRVLLLYCLYPSAQFSQTAKMQKAVISRSRQQQRIIETCTVMIQYPGTQIPGIFQCQTSISPGIQIFIFESTYSHHLSTEHVWHFWWLSGLSGCFILQGSAMTQV